jgi:hypothetical protein
MTRRPKAWLYFISWVGIPAIFAAFVGVEYHLSLKSGNLPFLGAREREWWAVFAASLLCGVACIARAHLHQRAARVIMPLLYITIMVAALLLIHFAVGSANGDSL